MNKKQRIDSLLVELQLVPTRQKAKALIMAGQVLVDETAVTKAGSQVSIDANIRIRGDQNPFVSRGGLKLNGALDDLEIDVTNKVIVDIGASTGGFTDCCLQRGAKKVFAVDVGTNQLDYKLRTNPNVNSMEKTNAKELNKEMFDTVPQIAVMDVSFISITKLLTQVVESIVDSGEIIAMVKPQFEVGREKVGKGGVVRDDKDRFGAVEKVIDYAKELGLDYIGTAESKIHGPKGNREIFIHLKKTVKP